MNMRDSIKEVLKEINRLNSLNLTVDNVDFVSGVWMVDVQP